MVPCHRFASELLCSILPIVGGQIVLRLLGDGDAYVENKKYANQKTPPHDLMRHCPLGPVTTV
jgi:hypothetical protein